MTNKITKNMSIDELAVLINKGFDGQMAYMEKRFGQIEQKMATKEQVQKVEVKVDKIDERLKNVEKVLVDACVLEVSN